MPSFLSETLSLYCLSSVCLFKDTFLGLRKSSLSLSLSLSHLVALMLQDVLPIFPLNLFEAATFQHPMARLSQEALACIGKQPHVANSSLCVWF